MATSSKEPPRTVRKVTIYKGKKVIFTDECASRWPIESANVAWGHLPLNLGDPSKIEVDGIQVYPELSNEKKQTLGVPKRHGGIRPKIPTTNRWFKIGIDVVRYLNERFTDPTGKEIRGKSAFVDQAIREKIASEGDTL